jgi:uncharacterized protein (TIGR02246 family)
MTSDEQQIRDVVARWMQATKAGDLGTVLSLMTEDVLFLVPGRPPMRKAEFAEISRAQAGAQAPAIDSSSEIQEVAVSGDLAYLWSRLSVSVTPKGGEPMERAGHTLTVFRKESGQWRLARDANLLAPVKK